FPCFLAGHRCDGVLPRLFTLAPFFVKSYHVRAGRMSSCLLNGEPISVSERAGQYVFCGTVRRAPNAFGAPPACIPQPASPTVAGAAAPGYAASRPLVFGLSSPPKISGGAILRPSKIRNNIWPRGQQSKP